MKGFTGARVIVVDDEVDEALPVLKALAKRGIPSIFFDANTDGPPLEDSCQLTGVRLAILDMDLTGGGTSPKSKISTLVNYLRKILSPNNGPYLVLAWTKHSDLVELFENYIFSNNDVPQPVHSLMIAKAECKDENNKLTLDKISQKLTEALSKFSPLLFLQHWEEKCFLASTEVTNNLSALVTPEVTDLKEYLKEWKEQFLQLLHAMAEAEADKHLDSGCCLSAVYGALGPLYADRMESHVANLSDLLSQNAEEIMQAPAECGIDGKARINSMLHLASEGLERFTGGNLYMFPEGIPGWLPDNLRLIEDCAQGEKIAHLKENYIPILIEISANCDHAQKNIRIARFLLGFMLPESERNNIKHDTNFIWQLGPLFIEYIQYMNEMDEFFFEEFHHYGGPNVWSLLSQIHAVYYSDNYNIYLSSRHFISLDLSKAKEMHPFARLRNQALVELQAWFAGHASRPGKVLLKETKEKKDKKKKC